MIHINTRVKIVRQNARLNQTEFGERIGVSQSAVAGYESGLRVPLNAVISSICREFDVSETWLRTGEGEMSVRISKENQLMRWAGEVLSEESTSFRHRFVSALAVLDEKDWKELERILLKMSEALNDDGK